MKRLAIAILALGLTSAYARNTDHRYDNAPNRAWFESLSVNGLSCCGMGDARFTDEWSIDKAGAAHVRVWSKSGVHWDFIVPKDRVLLSEAYRNPVGRGIVFTNDAMTVAYCFVPSIQA